MRFLVLPVGVAALFVIAGPVLVAAGDADVCAKGTGDEKIAALSPFLGTDLGGRVWLGGRSWRGDLGARAAERHNEDWSSLRAIEGYQDCKRRPRIRSLSIRSRLGVVRAPRHDIAYPHPESTVRSPARPCGSLSRLRLATCHLQQWTCRGAILF